MAKLNWARVEGERRVQRFGAEPASASLGEFPSSKVSKKVKRGSHQELLLLGKPTPLNEKLRKRWLKMIEKAYMKGDIIRLPESILSNLSAEIEQLRQRPDIREAFSKARKQRTPISVRTAGV